MQKFATYAVTVTGAADDTVTWSVVEANGGAITPNGHQCVYTAPATHGTYHLTATSVTDPTKSDTIAITVQSGSADVVIQ